MLKLVFQVFNIINYYQVQTTTGAAVGTAVVDDKGCYRLDVGQPFSYNYALVNQMSLAAAASFKCDVCGLAFAHISLLNHHKRVHAQNSVIWYFYLSVTNFSKL